MRRKGSQGRISVLDSTEPKIDLYKVRMTLIGTNASALSSCEQVSAQLTSCIGLLAATSPAVNGFLEEGKAEFVGVEVNVSRGFGEVERVFKVEEE